MFRAQAIAVAAVLLFVGCASGGPARDTANKVNRIQIHANCRKNNPQVDVSIKPYEVTVDSSWTARWILKGKLESMSVQPTSPNGTWPFANRPQVSVDDSANSGAVTSPEGRYPYTVRLVCGDGRVVTVDPIIIIGREGNR